MKEPPIRVGFKDSYEDLGDKPKLNGVELSGNRRIPKFFQVEEAPVDTEDCIAGDTAFDTVTSKLYICVEIGDELMWKKVNA